MAQTDSQLTPEQQERFGLQAAIKDINKVLAPTPKLRFIAQVPDLKQQIYDILSPLVAPEGSAEAWTDSRCNSLAPETILVYNKVFDEIEAMKPQGQSPEVAAAEAAGQPDPALVAGETQTVVETEKPGAEGQGDDEGCAAFKQGAGPATEGPYVDECANCPDKAECAEKAEQMKAQDTAPTKKTKEEKAAEKAKAKEAKKAERAAAKEARAASGQGTGKPGVIAAILEIIKSGPHSKAEILAKLKTKFPDRVEDSMKATINVQIPNRMAKDKNITISKNDAGQYFVA